MADAVALARLAEKDLTITGDMASQGAASLLISLSEAAELVVVGKSGRGEFGGMLVGSVAAAVISHAHCPVAVIRHPVGVLEVPATGPVVVGVDAGPNSDQAIATAFGDYAKKSFEEGNAFLEKLAGSKSWDKALEVQAEYAKNSFESFVAESQKIGGLYADIAKQAYKPFEGFVAKLTPASAN